MTTKRYSILIALAAVTLIWAYAASRSVVTDTAVMEGQLLLPDLEKNIGNVGMVMIRSKGMSFKVHIENGQWVMPNKYNYPIGAEKIRDLVQNSASTTILEKKTSTTENLASLGLGDPEKPDSSAIRIVLLSADGKITYADYIRGLNRKGVSGGTAPRDEIYARLFNSQQAYLVRGDLNFDLGAHTLLSGETFAVKAENLSKISFNYPKSAADNFTISKDIPGQQDFAITAPQGYKLKAFGKANAISTALEYMNLTDIVKREDFPVKEPEAHITYKTFNGLTMEVKLFKHGSDNWLAFAASADVKNKPASDDAARINKLAASWFYKVDFKSTGGFYYKLGDLLKD